jgi:glycosyltransferase involved in cell wall biosynthesis
MNVSVAMTTFNGEKYIYEQLESILLQLDKEDEIIISDDGSTDLTIDIIAKFSIDQRIKLFRNKSLGVVKNFEFVISRSSKDIIILSDQDDIWINNKVQIIKDYFHLNENKLLVLHNGIEFSECDSNHKKIMIKKKNNGVLSNLVNSSYWGCCMAFRRELNNKILPFPKGLIAHDQWIGLVGEFRKVSGFIDKNLILHRIHSSNVSKRLSISNWVKFRYNLLVKITLYYLKMKNNV